MKKPAKNNIGFKVRKKITRASMRMMPWLGAVVGLSQMAAIGVKHIVLTDEAGAKDQVVSTAAVKDIERDIAKFDKTTREYFELKTQANPPKPQQKKIETLEKTVTALPASISHRIISDKNLSEEDASRMLYAFKDASERLPTVMGYGLSYKQRQKMPDILVTLKNGLPYLADCRTAGASDDAIVSCAVAKTTENKETADAANIATLVGLPFGVMGIAFAGMALRRRVGEEEEEIKQSEFKASVDDLRDLLTPKTAPKPLPKKDR